MTDEEKRATALMAAAQYVRNHRHADRGEDCEMWKQLVKAFDDLAVIEGDHNKILTSPGTEPTELEVAAERALSDELWDEHDGGCIDREADGLGWPRSRPPM